MNILFITKPSDFAIDFAQLLAKETEKITKPVIEQVSDFSLLGNVIQRRVFDLILLDHDFSPEHDNASVLQVLKEVSARTPLWLLLDSLDVEEATQYVNSGVVNFAPRGNAEKLALMFSQFAQQKKTKKNDKAHQSFDEKKAFLKANKNILNAFLENASDSIWAKDLNGCYKFINRAGANFLGKTPEEIIGSDDSFLFSKETVAKIRATDVNVLRTGHSSSYEFILNSIDGEKERYYLAMKAPYHNEKDQVEGLIGIIRDITERKQMEDELLNAKIYAEEANQKKNQFISNMSHELRTPLHNIITSSQIMLDELLGPLDKKVESYFKTINTNGKHLLQIIDDLLDTSAIEAGKYEITPSETPLLEFLYGTFSLVEQVIDKKNQTLKIELEPTLPDCFGADVTKLRQALCNILSNATKYSPEGSQITFQCFITDETTLNFRVIDEGPGILESEKQRIFQPFEQGPSVNHNYVKGTGLGLPLAEKIIKLHGGNLTLVSSENSGSQFTISIPLSLSVSNANNKDYVPKKAYVKNI